MWVSYVGLILGIFGGYFSFAIIFYLAEQGKVSIIHLFIPLIPPLIGFLVGWKIHLLGMKLMKRADKKP